MSGLGVAFKEWAVICRALAEGRQAIILRKGGIAEEGGAFRAEHDRFWLYPTFVHQQEGGVTEAARPLLAQALADRPPPGVVRLTHFAQVPRVYRLDDLGRVLKLSHLHVWSPGTVEARFHYRTPGLFVLPVRVHRAAAHELAETPEYAGCKSWVALGRDLDAAGEPVLSDGAFAAVLDELDRVAGG